jgi:hypothetical protein
MTLPTACLVDDPPAYVAPKQTRPFFDYSHAYPPLSEIIQAKSGDKISFRMPVVSEDAGDRLEAFIVQEGAGTPDNLSKQFKPLPPSTLDDTSRVFSIEWTVLKSMAGCQRFTLIGTHYTNINFEAGGVIIDPADTAEANWWGNVDVDPINANKLADCPSAYRSAP